MLLAPRIALATPDLDVLLERIRQPAPASIAFTEARFSRLLKQPTIVTGQLGYLGSDHLDRSVERPYREHTEIRGESVRVTREGEPDRTFALQRAPELRTLLQAFASLLGGNRATLERYFRLQAEGDLDQWTLELTPLDAHIQRRLERVSITGKHELPQCFSLYTHDGGVSIMLLGAMASIDLSPTITPATLLRHCQFGQ